MSEFEAEYAAKGVEFIAVNAFEPAETGAAWADASGLEYTWAYADAAALEALGVAMAPAQILVGPGGKVLWTSSFSSIGDGASAVKEALDAALAGTGAPSTE